MPELITRIYKNKYLRAIWILTGVNLLLAAVQLITHRIPTLIYFILIFSVLGLQLLILLLQEREFRKQQREYRIKILEQLEQIKKPTNDQWVF